MNSKSTSQANFLYFLIFRWRFRFPRNVSTMEVSQIISSLPGVEEANVYGVQATLELEEMFLTSVNNMPSVGCLAHDITYFFQK